MSRDDWEHALARAIVERAFRARLLADPVGALAEYGLPEHDVSAIDGILSASLPEFAARLLRLSTGVWMLDRGG